MKRAIRITMYFFLSIISFSDAYGQTQKFEMAFESFNKLQTQIEIEINKLEYTKMLGDILFKVKEITAQNKDQEWAKSDLLMAIGYHKRALKLWNDAISSNKWSIKRNSFEGADLLNALSGIDPKSPILERPEKTPYNYQGYSDDIIVRDAIQLFWKGASEKVAAAQEILKKSE